MSSISDVFKKPKLYWFILIFVFYLFLNIMFSGFYNTFPLIAKYALTVNWLKLGLSLLFTLIIGFLVSVNSVLIFMKYKERKACKGKGLAGIGTAGGLIVGVCPLCVSGLVPLILGMLGTSFSFASLPFQGIEIQIIIIAILSVSLSFLERK